jgi:hypothetical protein
MRIAFLSPIKITCALEFYLRQARSDEKRFYRFYAAPSFHTACSRRSLRNPIRYFGLLLPQAEVLDRGWQSLGLVGPAVARDFRRVLLKGVIVQDGAIGGRIVITANPKADEIPVLLAIPKPTAASDLIHIYSDLSRTRD